MEVFEVDFNDSTLKGELPVVVYSSVSLKPNGTPIKLVNIEPINNAKGMDIEVFGTNNFYIKGNIESSVSKLNIFSFRCDLDKRYFIKILTEEFRNEGYNEYVVNTLDNDKKVNLLFYGFYQFESHLLELMHIETVYSNNLYNTNNKSKRNITMSITQKQKKSNLADYGFNSKNENSKMDEISDSNDSAISDEESDSESENFDEDENSNITKDTNDESLSNDRESEENSNSTSNLTNNTQEQDNKLPDNNSETDDGNNSSKEDVTVKEPDNNIENDETSSNK